MVVSPGTEQGSTIASATLYGVDCPTTRIGTAVGAEGTILRTENGGANWHSQTSGTRYLLRGVSFVSADTGTTVGTMGTILRTVDGLKWKAQTSGTIRALNGVSFTTSKIGTIVGSSGTILRTTDGGTNWGFADKRNDPYSERRRHDCCDRSSCRWGLRDHSPHNKQRDDLGQAQKRFDI